MLRLRLKYVNRKNEKVRGRPADDRRSRAKFTNSTAGDRRRPSNLKIQKFRSPPMTAHARGRPAVDRRLSAGVWTTAKKVGGSATSPPQTFFILSCSCRLTTYHAALGCYATHRMELVCRKTWSFTARSCRDFSLVDSTRVPSVT